VLLTALVAAPAGCGRSRPPETAPVLAAFEVITNTNRFLVDLAVQQTREGNYTGALASLAELERRYRLSPEQEIAVRTLRRDLQRRVPADAAPTHESPAPAARPAR
jgi:hypothetical protein